MFELISSGEEGAIIARLRQISEMPRARKREQLEAKLNGKSLVHAAVARGNLAALQYLLQILDDATMEAWSNQQDLEGNTPLHDAVLKGEIAIIRELIGQDVSLSIANNAGLTACGIAEQQCTVEGNVENFQQIAGLLRTRGEWQAAPSARGFKFNKVIGLIERSFPAIEPAGGTDKVFFIGGTGAGKTTLVNYINGTRYRTEVTQGGRPVAIAIGGEPEIGRTGHGMSSQTLYPQVIKKEHLNYTYCDLAGLADSRGRAIQICATSSVQILSRLPGNIKGICLVLDVPSFVASRGTAFKGTAVALAQMVNNNPRLMDSVYYIITKIPDGCRDLNSGKFLTRPSDIIDTYVDPLLDTLGEENNNSSDELALRFMLEQMRQHSNNIIIPDITDDGRSKAELERLLSELPGQQSSAYNFVNHDGAQQSFNDSVTGIAEGYLSRIAASTVDLPAQIVAQEILEREIQQRITNLAQEIIARENDMNVGYNVADIDAQITVKQAQIANNDREIAVKNAAIVARTGEIGTFQGEINTLNTDEKIHVENLRYDIPGRPQHAPLRYQSRFPCYGPESVGGFFWGYGSLSAELLPECNAMSGLYSAMLHATEGLTSVDVTFKTHKKYIHAARIAQLRDAIGQKHRENHADSMAVNRLNLENEQLRREILDCEREKIQGRADAQIRANRLEAEIATRKEWSTAANAYLTAATAAKLALQQKLADTKIEISVNQDLFNIIYRMSRILELNGIPAIAQFLGAFEAANPEAAGRYEQWFRDMLETARAQNRLAGLDLAAPAGREARLPQFRAHARPAFAAAGADAGAEFIGDRARRPAVGIRRAAQ